MLSVVIHPVDRKRRAERVLNGEKALIRVVITTIQFEFVISQQGQVSQNGR